MEKSQYVRVVVSCHSIVDQPNLQSPVQCPFCLTSVSAPDPVHPVTPVTCGHCQEEFHVIFIDAGVVAAVACAVDEVVPRLTLRPPVRSKLADWNPPPQDQSAIIP